MVTIEDDGTQTATVGVEHELFVSSDAKVFTLIVDANEMVNGDNLVLRVYGIVISTGAERVVFEATYAHIQAEPIKVSIPFPSPGHTDGYRVTLNQSAGSGGRDFDWSVVSTG